MDIVILDSSLELEAKLESAVMSYNKWLDKALSCECDSEMLEVAELYVSPAWAKVVELRDEVNRVKTISKWSNTLSGYKVCKEL